MSDLITRCPQVIRLNVTFSSLICFKLTIASHLDQLRCWVHYTSALPSPEAISPGGSQAWHLTAGSTEPCGAAGFLAWLGQPAVTPWMGLTPAASECIAVWQRQVVLPLC